MLKFTVGCWLNIEVKNDVTQLREKLILAIWYIRRGMLSKTVLLHNDNESNHSRGTKATVAV